METLRRALLYGIPCGIAAELIGREATLFLLHHVGKVMRYGAWSNAPGPYGLPVVAWFVLLGAVGGVALALLVRSVRALPDLLTGAVLGAAAGYLLPQYLPPGTPVWVGPLAGAGWGWGTVFLLRPLALRG